MNPKMTAKDAAGFLGISPKQVYKKLVKSRLPFSKVHSSVYFHYSTAKEFFKFQHRPTSIAFQIVKGGTGKTSIAFSVAIRANLYGLRVLCIDLDQQGNLTHCFDVDSETLPVMVDILAEGYTYKDAITRVYPGMDLLSSRIENSLIDDVIKLKKLCLDKVYKDPFQELKQEYDLIVVDCPPNLGQSVAAVTLAVDKVVAPVIPEHFAIHGLNATSSAIAEIQENYHVQIPFNILFNRYDARTILSQEAMRIFKENPTYKKNLLSTYVRTSQEYPNAVAKELTIYDTIKPTIAKKDIDSLTRELLNIRPVISIPNESNKLFSASKFETEFI